MGILEIHFHDSDFSWNVNPRGSEDGGALPFGSDESESQPETDGGETPAPSVANKLRTVGMLAVLVGLGVALSRLRSRRARKAAESNEQGSSGRRFSLSRSK
ncbi:hypothetical protein [Halorussus amylolyticus]|uniref:hypothetical protein n=1 Tax=Halorussus amylolyticus TaxID=1126242 RepID=UPI00138F441F|nr:hypothetical protein [Halorussus amylolyticus]